MLEGVHLYPLMADLCFHRWDEILKAPVPRPERKLHHAFWQYARAMALAGQGVGPRTLILHSRGITRVRWVLQTCSWSQ